MSEICRGDRAVTEGYAKEMFAVRCNDLIANIDDILRFPVNVIVRSQLEELQGVAIVFKDIFKNK